MKVKVKHIIEKVISPEIVETEDGGMAKTVALVRDIIEETGMYVRVISWDEAGVHSEFNQFLGRKVRITIETID